MTYVLAAPGKNTKKCCISKNSIEIKELPYGLRMKGGVAFDPEKNGYIAIINSWDNVECLGDPQQWSSPQVFSTEEAAMQYYKASLRPKLERIMSEIQQEHSRVKLDYSKLE